MKALTVAVAALVLGGCGSGFDSSSEAGGGYGSENPALADDAGAGLGCASGAAGASAAGSGGAMTPIIGESDPANPPGMKDPSGSWIYPGNCELSSGTGLTACTAGFFSHAGECGAPCVYTGTGNSWCCPIKWD